MLTYLPQRLTDGAVIDLGWHDFGLLDDGRARDDCPSTAGDAEIRR
jgi:hypothetical protein